MAKNKNYDSSTFTENIIESPIDETAENWQKIYGTNKNVYRYFPAVYDGLKPVERRLLYSMYIAKRYHGTMIKLARASANAVVFHPHGNTAISGVAVGLAQPWNMNIPLIASDGNVGSITGDAAASERYLDVTLSEFATDCFFSDFKDTALDFKKAYTGEDYEPEYLPCKYPIGIINGGFASIGYAFSSNIPPYNFTEVCEAVIALIKDPNAKILLYPDLPSCCDLVMTKKEAKEIFEKGIGKVCMRASATIDYIANTITFTSLPMQVSSGMVTQAITKLRMENKIDGIVEVNDYTTTNDGDQSSKNKKKVTDDDKRRVELEIVLRSDVNPEVFLQTLYKSRTNLKKTNAAVVTLVDDYVSNEYSIRNALLTWLSYDRDRVRNTLNNKYIKRLDEYHTNEVKLRIYSKENIEKTIAIAKSSATKAEYKEKLMKAYGITSIQAETIANLPTSAWNKDSYQGFKDLKESLAKELNTIKEMLETDGSVDKVIIEELKDGIKKYGYPRRSKIISDETEVSDESVLIGISEDGFIKKILDKKKPIGKVTKKANTMVTVIPAKNSDTVLLFDSNGYMHSFAVASLPTLKDSDAGLSVAKYVNNWGSDTRLITCFLAPKSKKDMDVCRFVLVTENGMAKQVIVSNLFKEKRGLVCSIPAIVLNDGDHLGAVLATMDEDKDLILYTDYGNGMRLPISEINTQLPGSKGTRIGVMAGRERFIGLDVIKRSDQYMVYVTSAGRIKKTELKLLPKMKKKEELLVLTGLESGEFLVSVKSVKDKDTVKFYKKNSDPEVLSVKQIPLKMRAAKADKLIKCKKGDMVLSMLILN